jgi:hypothetical protein
MCVHRPSEINSGKLGQYEGKNGNVTHTSIKGDVEVGIISKANLEQQGEQQKK